MTVNWPSATDLFGTPQCELGDRPAAAFFTDEWGSAWLCRRHSLEFGQVQTSIGRVLASWLREKAA